MFSQRTEKSTYQHLLYDWVDYLPKLFYFKLCKMTSSPVTLNRGLSEWNSSVVLRCNINIFCVNNI